MRHLKVFVLGLAPLLLASSASAALVNVDFYKSTGTAGDYVGAGVLGSAGDIWNPVTSAVTSGFTSGALVDSSGAASPVTVTVGAFRGTADLTGNASGTCPECGSDI